VQKVTRSLENQPPPCRRLLDEGNGAHESLRLTKKTIWARHIEPRIT
jgi:hypothetical protein